MTKLLCCYRCKRIFDDPSEKETCVCDYKRLEQGELKEEPITIIIERDGSMWFAHRPDFVDLQESIVGWGACPKEATENFLVNVGLN